LFVVSFSNAVIFLDKRKLLALDVSADAEHS
jgi:hypothetical protein